ncbi:MAG TPA: hypothetical protein PLV68_08955, partial [Ilumatobacteraceae bacterium]|nr:hypothetical protein [Ilumatobacteraceae bacterium]
MSSEAMPHGALPEPMSELAAEPQCGATAARRARRRKTFAIVGVIAVLVVGGGLLYFEPWTLFIDKKVDEALPGMPSTPVATAGPSSIASAIASAAATGQPVIVSMTEFIS